MPITGNADVFNRRSGNIGGNFSPDSAIIDFGIGGTQLSTTGLAVQSLNYSYQQPIQKIYDLASAFTYYIAGRAMGQGSIKRVLGPVPLLLTFYTQYGDVCKSARNNINIQLLAGCISANSATPAAGQAQTGASEIANGSGMQLRMTGLVLNNVAGNVEAQQFLFGEDISFMFNGLEVCNGNGLKLDGYGRSCSIGSALGAVAGGLAAGA